MIWKVPFQKTLSYGVLSLTMVISISAKAKPKQNLARRIKSPMAMIEQLP